MRRWRRRRRATICECPCSWVPSLIALDFDGGGTAIPKSAYDARMCSTALAPAREDGARAPSAGAPCCIPERVLKTKHEQHGLVTHLAQFRRMRMPTLRDRAQPRQDSD